MFKFKNIKDFEKIYDDRYHVYLYLHSYEYDTTNKFIYNKVFKKKTREIKIERS